MWSASESLGSGYSFLLNYFVVNSMFVCLFPVYSHLNIRWITEKARVPEKHLFLLYWLCQSLWLCGSQETVENSERDGNTRPPDLSLKKPVCNEHWGTRVSFPSGFLSVYAQQWDCWIIRPNVHRSTVYNSQDMEAT